MSEKILLTFYNSQLAQDDINEESINQSLRLINSVKDRKEALKTLTRVLMFPLVDCLYCSIFPISLLFNPSLKCFSKCIVSIFSILPSHNKMFLLEDPLFSLS